MMLNKKDIIYYFTLAGLFFLLKLTYTTAGNEDVFLFLYPVDQIIGILLNSDSTYNPLVGYYHESLNILIDKSCSGFNFFLIAFVMFAYLGWKSGVEYFQNIRPLTPISVLVISFILAYVLTIFVNSSRIYVSMILERQIPFQRELFHQGIGITTNLTFLILAYFLAEKLLTNKKYHEKLT